MASGGRTIGVVVLVALLMGAAASLQAVRESAYPPPPVTDDAVYLTSGTAVKRLTVGFSALAADLYWIRAIQYYGGVKLRLQKSPQPSTPGAAASEYQQLYPMLD